MRYWINTISRDHVLRGVKDGFTQANHGRPTNLRRMAEGDLMVCYSPRTSHPDGAPLQRFTAIGRVVDAEPYQAEMAPDFHPWRRRVAFLPSKEAAIHPLLNELALTQGRKSWGFVFRRGLFEIGAKDFHRIAQAMSVEI